VPPVRVPYRVLGTRTRPKSGRLSRNRPRLESGGLEPFAKGFRNGFEMVPVSLPARLPAAHFEAPCSGPRGTDSTWLTREQHAGNVCRVSGWSTGLFATEDLFVRNSDEANDSRRTTVALPEDSRSTTEKIVMNRERNGAHTNAVHKTSEDEIRHQSLALVGVT